MFSKSYFGPPPKLNDPGKPPLRRLGTLPRQFRTSPLLAPLIGSSTPIRE